MNHLHLTAAIVWLGDVAFMQFSLRPAAIKSHAPARLSLLAQLNLLLGALAVAAVVLLA